MTSILTPNELCSSILNLGTQLLSSENISRNKKHDDSNSKTSNDFREEMIPQLTQFPKKELILISNQLKSNEKQFKIILNEHNFEFMWSLDLLKKVTDTILGENSDSTTKNIACLTQMHSCMSILIESFNNPTFASDSGMHQKYRELLSSCLLLIETPFVNQNTKMNSICNSCCIHLMRNYLQFDDFDEHFALNLIEQYYSFIENSNSAVKKKIFSKQTKFVPSFVLISDIGKTFAKKQSPYLNHLVEFTYKLMQTYPNTFPKETAISFAINVLKSSTSFIALQCFHHLISIIGADTLQSSIQLLLNVIISCSASYSSNDEAETSEIISLPQVPNHQSQPFSIINWNTFDSKLEFNQSEIKKKFPELVLLAEQIPPELLNVINEILIILAEAPSLIPNFVNLAQDYFGSNQSNSNIVENASFTYLMLTLLKGDYFGSFDLSKEIQFTTYDYFPIPVFLNQTVIDSSNTIFAPNINQQKFSVANTLRTLVLSIFIENGIPSLNSIFYDVLYDPYLFAEFTYRLSTFNFKIQKDDVVVLSQMFMYAMKYYQQFSNLEERQLKAINIARKSIFYLFSEMFQNKTKMMQFFQDSNFVENYLSCTFEYYPRAHILDFLSQYYALNENLANNECLKKMNQLIIIILNSINMKDYVELCSDYLKMINKIVQKNRLLGFYFVPIIPAICQQLSKLVKNDKVSQDFICHFIQLLTISTEFHIMTDSQVLQLQTAIISSFGDEPPQNLFKLLVNLMAGQENNSLSYSFQIQQPSILRILLSVYLNSKICQDLFMFIAKLCQFSKKNCIAAHNGEVDSLLLDILFEWRNNPSVTVNAFASAMSLFMLITKTISSLSIVQKFMTLFSPIHRKFLPKYHCIVIKSMASILESAQKRPFSCLPLQNGSKFEVSGLKGESFAKGFTISIWLFNFTNKDYKAQILSLYDSRGQRLTVIQQDGAITTIFDCINKNNSKPEQWSYSTNFKLLENSWNYITITVENNETNSLLTITANNENSCDTKMNWFQFASGMISGCIGGFASKRSDPSLLKSICFLNVLDKTSIQKLHQQGHTGDALNSSFCNLVFDEKDGQIFINHDSDNLILKPASIQVMISNNFCSIYIKKCTMNMIVPLFAQFSLTYEKGEIVQNLPSIAFDVLKNSLILVSETKNHFANHDDFKMLLHLLLSSESKLITYKFYLKVYEIFQVISDQQSKESIFSFILMNIDLLMKANPEDHVKILRHWSETLIPSNITLTISKKPLQWVLFILRSYYWYTPIENSLIVNIPNRVTSNITKCRNILFEIATTIAHYQITEYDFTCIISNILTCTDTKQCIELLKYTYNLIDNCEKAKLTRINISKLIALLQYSFNCKNEEMICIALEIIALAHKKEIISEFSLTAHIDIILHQLSSSYVTKSLLSNLLQVTKNDFPELFTICSWIALNLGNNAVREMLNTLKPSKAFETSEFWSIWLVVALYKSDEKLQTFIARYLIKCSQNFLYVFSTCEIVGNALNENVPKVKKIIVTEYGKLLLRDDYEKTEQDLLNYFSLSKHYLFYHREPQRSKMLEQLYMESPFLLDENVPHVHFSDRSPKKTLRKERRRKERHSIRRDSIQNNQQYSTQVDDEAISILIPHRSALYDDCIQSKTTPMLFKSKRTSMLTVRQNTLCSPKKHVSDKKILSLTPIEFDTKVRAIASQEIEYTFGLRLNEKMDWLDIDIAKQGIAVYQKCPDTRVAEIILLICSYLIHYSFNEVRSVITKIGIHSKRLNNNYCFFLHHCQLSKIKTKDYSLSIENCTKDFLQSIETSVDKNFSTSPLRFLKHFLKFQSSNSTISMDICELLNESIVGLSSSIIANYADENAILIDTSKQLWNQNWHNMTMDKAPWHRSISNVHEIHFKRDFTLCSNLCPSKIARNYCFDDHMKASLVRDVGDCASAQQYLDKYKDEHSKQYKDKEILPLFDVIEEKTSSNNVIMDPLIEKIETNETKCLLELPCEYIKMKTTKNGTFALFTKSIILTKSEKKSMIIDLNDVTNVLLRTRFHHPTAIEIFTTFGKTFFINFPNVKALTILKAFKSADLPRNARIQNSDFYTYFQNTKVIDQWINRKISNFEYLMHLNILSGRSFNDASQYPVIPWVINDYSSDKCDFSNPNFFRDLTKPIGALNEERLSLLIEKCEQLESMGMDSYLYSNGLVCPLSVYLWLLRQEPFTSLHIDIQSGKFDHAARLFSSIESAYFIATNHQNDFRELIPEFYSSPEFLLNSNKFDLGSVNGTKIGDVELPKWASNVFEFVYLMRKALESDYVSNHINQWIDLIWGEKQKGKKAKAANNVYLKEMYEDIWTPENLADPEKRAHIEAILCHVGQVPPQLFDKPHPQRMNISVHPCIINKPVRIQMPTSHLITSSIDLRFINSKKSIMIYAVDLSGQLIEVNLPISIFNNDSEKRIIKLHKSSSGLLQSKDVKLPEEFVTSSHISKPCQTAKKDIHCQIGYTKFGLVSANGYDLFIADPDTKTTNQYIHHNSEIVALSSTETNPEWIAIADKDASLSLYYKNVMKATIQTFMKSITCMAFDLGFKQIVCGTSDNSLLFCSVSSNSISITRVVELNELTPSKVVITKGWGFAVVYSTRMNEGNLCHYLHLYSINGDLIRQVEIEKPIEQFETYKNNDGFDFIIAKDNNNRLYSFEAFYLNMESPFYTKSEMSTISFIPDKSISIHISHDGGIIFAPFHENM